MTRPDQLPPHSDHSGDPRRLSHAPWFTPANALTGLRLLAAPLCAVAIVEGAATGAVLLFALAVVTDLADGRLARRRGEESALGGLLDHATDATFVSLGLAALAYLGAVPVLLPILVALAFVQYMLDSKTLAGRPLRASWLGRWNGIAYFVLLGTPVIRDALGLTWPGNAIVLVLGWALALSTLASMLNRGHAFLQLHRSKRR